MVNATISRIHWRAGGKEGVHLLADDMWPLLKPQNETTGLNGFASRSQAAGGVGCMERKGIWAMGVNPGSTLYQVVCLAWVSHLLSLSPLSSAVKRGWQIDLIINLPHEVLGGWLRISAGTVWIVSPHVGCSYYDQYYMLSVLLLLLSGGWKLNKYCMKQHPH